MTRLFNLAAALAISLLFATGSLAQSGNHWIEIERFNDFNQAESSAQELQKRIAGITIAETQDGRYAVVTGGYTSSVANRFRSRLIDAGLISASSRVKGEGQFLRFDVRSQRQSSVPHTPGNFDNSEKTALQSALQWYGFYTGPIDGLIGAGSRRAISEYQASQGFDPTGGLSRKQFNTLLAAYNSEIELVGLRRTELEEAGISVEIPTEMFRFARIEEPFIYFEPNPPYQRIQLVLISIPGNRKSLEAVYAYVQGLSFVSDDGTQSLTKQKFLINTGNEQLRTYADVRLLESRIKGFILLWHPDNEEIMLRIARVISASLRESDDRTLLIPIESESRSHSDPLLSLLDLPTARSRHTGFFADAQGAIVTSGIKRDVCETLYLVPNTELTIAAVSADQSLAVLLPETTQAPLAYAKLRSSEPTKGEPIMVSGFSFGGELGGPTRTRGSWAGRDPTTPDAMRFFVTANVQDGDIGGPVLDQTGAVAGVLAAPKDETRILPKGNHSAVSQRAIAELLTESGRQATYSIHATKLDDQYLGRLATDMTVLIECY